MNAIFWPCKIRRGNLFWVPGNCGEQDAEVREK